MAAVVGCSGDPGERGENGTVGPAGPAGVAGPPGAAGPAGAVGPAGAEGQQGAPGAAGPAGMQGADGAPGAAGAPGTPGANGAPGAAGPSGLVKVLDFEAAWGNVNLPGGNAVTLPVGCRTVAHVAGTGEAAVVAIQAAAAPSAVVDDALFLAVAFSQNGAPFAYASAQYTAAPITDTVANLSTSKRIVLTPGVSYVFAAGFETNNAVPLGAFATCHGTVTIVKP